MDDGGCGSHNTTSGIAVGLDSRGGVTAMLTTFGLGFVVGFLTMFGVWCMLEYTRR
jgi:hypothetical protein